MEYFSGCSGNSKNAVYRQQSLTDRLYGEIDKLKAKYILLKQNSASQKSDIRYNKRLATSAIKGVQDGKKDMEGDLAKIDKKSKKSSNFGQSKQINSGKPKSQKDFSNAMRFN